MKTRNRRGCLKPDDEDHLTEKRTVRGQPMEGTQSHRSGRGARVACSSGSVCVYAVLARLPSNLLRLVIRSPALHVAGSGGYYGQEKGRTLLIHRSVLGAFWHGFGRYQRVCGPGERIARIPFHIQCPVGALSRYIGSPRPTGRDSLVDPMCCEADMTGRELLAIAGCVPTDITRSNSGANSTERLVPPDRQHDQSGEPYLFDLPWSHQAVGIIRQRSVQIVVTR